MSEKTFTSADLGFCAFLYYLDPDRLLHAEVTAKGKDVQFVFDDTMPKDGMDSLYLKDLYFSRESALLRNAREFSNCYKQIVAHMIAAKKAGPGEQVRL